MNTYILEFFLWIALSNEMILGELLLHNRKVSFSKKQFQNQDSEIHNFWEWGVTKLRKWGLETRSIKIKRTIALYIHVSYVLTFIIQVAILKQH